MITINESTNAVRLYCKRLQFYVLDCIILRSAEVQKGLKMVSIKQETRGYTLAMSLRVSCGVNRRMVDSTRTRFG